MKGTLKWLWSVPGRKKGYVIVLTLIQIMTGGTGVLYALLMRNIVDGAVNHDFTSFRNNVIFLVLLTVLLIGISAATRRLYMRAYSDIENVFKRHLTDQIMRRDYASVNAVDSGDWMTRLTSDASLVARGCVDLVPGLTGTVVRLIAALIMIIVLDRWFAYILVPGGVALVIVSYMLRKIMKRLHKNIQEKDGRLRTYLQERIGSLMIIKAFSAEEQTVEGAWDRMQDHKAARMKSNAFSIFCGVGFSVAMRGMYLICMVYCAYGIFSGNVTYGTLTAILQLVGQVQSPFANLSGFVSRFYAMTASAERLMEIESFREDCEETVYTAEEIRDYYERKFKAIRLEHVHFAYPHTTDKADGQDQANLPVLTDFSFEIQKGEYVAFTGHSGCGKSTVLKLLTCMYPLNDGERRLLDTEGSVPLTQRWRRLFAYVPQGNHLMSGKLRDVVAFACPDQADNDEKMLRSLSIACADDFLPELENGLDTQLGEGGTGLSEGQMQRIAIARAIFSEAPVLLLDEATSALDTDTEKRLLQNLRSLTNRTVLIVTHRREVLSICDRELHFSE